MSPRWGLGFAPSWGLGVRPLWGRGENEHLVASRSGLQKEMPRFARETRVSLDLHPHLVFAVVPENTAGFDSQRATL